MVSKYTMFDTSQIKVKPIQARTSLVKVEDLIDPTTAGSPYKYAPVDNLAKHIIRAREGVERRMTHQGRRVMLFMGAHLIKLGLSNYIINLIKDGWITSISTTGAGLIHDWELARYGVTSESVSNNLTDGSFGHWDSMVELNGCLNMRWAGGEGLGEAVGAFMAASKSTKHDAHSIFAQAWLHQVPVTVHPTIGADIAHQAPNCVGETWGALAQRDFLIFTEQVRRLDQGVFVLMGSAVTGPEVFLKALSMARNVQKGKPDSFQTAVFDLNVLGGMGWKIPKGNVKPATTHYYWRPGKTVMTRAMPEGRLGLFVPGDLQQTLPSLYERLIDANPGS